MARKPKVDPYAAQAANAALVRYGPEGSVLAQLLRDAEERRDTALRQARGGREYTTAALDAAGPQLQSAYRGAQAAVTPAFAGGGGIEASALTARIGEARAQSLSQLAERKVSAVEGEQAGRTQALRDYATDRGKVTARVLDLAQERGAFTAQTIADLKGADAAAEADAAKFGAQLTQSERNSIRSSGIDPDTRQPIPGGRLDPKAKKGKGNGGAGWATANEQGEAADKIGDAYKWAKKFHDNHVSRSEAAQSLLAGSEEKSVPVMDPNTGKPAVWTEDDVKNKVIDPNTKKPVDPNLVNTPVKRILQPGLPKIDSQLMLSAALDQAYDGHLSLRNQKLLHARGIKLEPLGLVTYGEWRRRQRASRPDLSRGTGNPASAPYTGLG